MVAVQGRFSPGEGGDGVAAGLGPGYDDIVAGQEFGRAKHLPPAWFLERVLLQVARAVSPSMEVGPAAAPFMLMPAVAGCNAIHVALPGDEPDVAGPPVEDMRLAHPRLLAGPGGEALPPERRRAFFADPANRVGPGAAYDPALVYTFWFYQHLVDASTYRLDFVLS